MTAPWKLGLAWRRGLQLLSLDFVRPVYEELGVGVACHETLRGLARDLLAGRCTTKRHPEPQSVEGLEAFCASEIPVFLQMLEGALGSSDQKKVVHWVRYVACTEDHNPWVPYQEFLLSWASAFRNKGKDEIGFSVDASTITLRLGLIGDLKRVEEVLCRRGRSFLTEWDFPLFKDLGLLEIPAGSHFFPFVDAILLAIDMRRFQVFWLWFISFVGQHDLQSVDAVLRKRSNDAGIPHCPPWELPLPDESRSCPDLVR